MSNRMFAHPYRPRKQVGVRHVAGDNRPAQQAQRHLVPHDLRKEYR